MQQQTVLMTVCVFYIILITVSSTGSRSYFDRSRDPLLHLRDPEEVAEILQNIEDNLPQSSNTFNVKRNLDLGFSRGFSGSQAAKHLMGLAAANFAGGPGRKRRSLNTMEEK